MTIYQALESRVRKLQKLQESEKQKRRLHLLPPLTRDLKRIASALDHFMSCRRLWADVYQQPAIPADRTLRQALNKPVKIIADSMAVFDVSGNELGSFQEALRALADKLGQWQRKLEKHIDVFCEERSQAVKTTQALLRIPDLLDDQDERQRVEELLHDLLEFLNAEDMQQYLHEAEALAEEWHTAWSEYEALQSRLSLDALSQRFSLSQQAVSTLSQFINGEALQLGDVPASVLQELQQIRRFAAQVTLRFEAK